MVLAFLPVGTTAAREEVILDAALELIAVNGERDTASFPNSHAAGPRITRIVRHNSEVPGLVELYSALVQEGVDLEHPAHDFFSERYQQVTGNVRADIRHGEGGMA
ncbi:hypothetical protein [Nonomuraea sp. 10N515B]|uniref:hypothetical protein n=1 Tax=Nonomuraea sp. 10N515B TaxID=3457422 RepID=UPI003FCE1427